ncbi:MAG: T9SS type A sorting domain-containing protein [Bacteroidetes bacterium]|nr:T9SS type A sorting domain-containing protein [Bacteroidota bacterium]
MKKVFLALAAVFCSGATVLNAQAFNSATSVFGGTYTPTDLALDVEVTNTSQKIVVGSRINSAGNNDGYVRMFDAANNIVFEYIIAGAGDDVVNATDKFTTTSGADIYITGHFTGTATVNRTIFPGSPTVVATLSTVSGITTDQTYFVMKLNTAGTYIWSYTAGQIGSSDAETGNDVTVQLVNNIRTVYTTGAFKGATTFLSAAANIAKTSVGAGYDVFVAQYRDFNTGAGLNWVNTASSPAGADNDYGFGLDADNNGILYVTGSVAAGTSTFNSTGGPAQITAAGFGDDDVFVARYSYTGLCTHTRLLGGNGVSAGVADQGRGIAVTNNGANVYVSGYYRGAGGSFSASSGQTEGFVQYITAATLTPGWFRTVRSTGFDGCYRLCLTPAETYCLVSGNYEGNVTVYNNTGVAMYSDIFCASGTPNIDGFVLRLDAGTGNSPVLGRVCGVSALDVTSSVDASNNNDAVTCGYYSSALLTFEGSVPTLTNASAPNYDAFFSVFIPFSILRVGQFTDNETLPVTGMLVYPNPTSGTFTLISESAAQDNPEQLVVLDLAGRIVKSEPVTRMQTEVSIAGLPAGTYVWQVIRYNGSRETGKLIVTE